MSFADIWEQDFRISSDGRKWDRYSNILDDKNIHVVDMCLRSSQLVEIPE